MGGTNEANNLIKLSVTDHAEAHRLLYEQHGHWQDFIAWKGLLGLIDSDECTYISIVEGAKQGSRKGNKIRWGEHIKFKDDPDFVPYYKRQFGYAKGVDGRKIRTKRYWYNNGVSEGQFGLNEAPDGWNRGRLKSVMNRINVKL